MTTAGESAQGETLLLARANGAARGYDAVNRKTGAGFNIFEIAHIETDEVAICRVIYELLDPSGRHGHGASFLRLFFSEVLRIDVSDAELAAVRVYREYVIAGNRRIDLAIETPARFIPIEVKIYAGEQERQCSDYLRLAKNSNLYYLTVFGDPPSEYSVAKEERDNVACISFERDIAQWLDSCVRLPEILKLAPIREVLLQLISAIMKITNQMGGELQMEIAELVRNQFDDAQNISSALQYVKADVMARVFMDIEKHVGDRLRKISRDDYGIAAAKYYDRQTGLGCGLWYAIPDTKHFLAFEVADFLYFGVPAGRLDEQGRYEKLAPSDEDKRFVRETLDPFGNDNATQWWYWYDHLPDNSERINFRTCDGAYRQLLDESGRRELMERVCARVDECIDGIGKRKG
jgi:hypothetical protein